MLGVVHEFEYGLGCTFTGVTETNQLAMALFQHIVPPPPSSSSESNTVNYDISVIDTIITFFC